MVKEKKITKASIAREEKRLLKEQDKKFALDIKARDEFKCVICGDLKNLHTHHILPREQKDVRHALLNGITLCCLHHKFSLKISPHKNAFEFFVWLAEHRPEQFNFCRSHLQRDYKSGE